MVEKADLSQDNHLVWYKSCADEYKFNACLLFILALTRFQDCHKQKDLPHTSNPSRMIIIIILRLVSQHVRYLIDIDCSLEQIDASLRLVSFPTM